MRQFSTGVLSNFALIVFAALALAALRISSAQQIGGHIAGGDDASCAIRNGTITCWGSTAHGKSTPPTIPSQRRVVQICTGGGHGCAILDDGSAVCWALNNHGQATPPTLAHPLVFVEIVCGWQFTCARISNSSVQCWGQNDYGQTTVPSSSLEFVSISAGVTHMCGILNDMSTICWGDNTAGQGSIVPLAPNLRYVQMASGYQHTCGLVSDGTVKCWGSVAHGKTTVPALASPQHFVQITVGGHQSCGLVSDGTISCWGASMGAAPTVPGMFVQVMAGSHHVLALVSDGSFACWGAQNGGGQLNIPAALQQPSAARTTPTGYYRQGSIAAACPAGRYASTTDHISPMCQASCTAGSYCPTGSSAPVPCAPGVYCSAGSTAASGAGPCPAGYYCTAGADRVACASCASGSSAPPRATITRTTSVWTIGENNAGVVNYKCVTDALNVSSSLAFSAMSVRVARGVFTAAAYASSAQPGGSQQGVWLYQGCFVDDSGARLLPVRLAAALGPTDAALSCMALARAAGYSVVGMEAWAPPNGECWGLPADAVSHWRTAAVNEGYCGDGAAELPSGLRWGTANWGIAVYQFNLPVAGQTYGIVSPGYQTIYPNDHFLWSVSFPSSTTASVCATAFQRGNSWGDSTLKANVVLELTNCDAGQYASGARVCVPCAAGAYSSAPGASACVACGAGLVAHVDAISCMAACPSGQYNNNGTCALCASNCAACTAGAAGGICTACAAGFSLTYPNTCVATATATATATGVWTFGANTVMNAVVCQSTPLTMAVSRTSAFSSITLTTNGGTTTVVSANNGDGSCFGCATAAPSVSAAGYQSSTGDVMLWQLSFPTRSTVQMCVSRPGGDSGRWADTNVRIGYSIVTTPCSAGEFIDANYICRKCPAGTFGATTPLVGAHCSGPCAPGTYSVLGSTACSATAACPIGQYKNQTTGACATCSGATPVVAATGLACVASCSAGTLNVNGLCTPSAAEATYADTFAIGAHDNTGVVQCCPVIMTALSPTTALKSVSLEVHNGVSAYTASMGQCFGCATPVMTAVQSSGYQPAFSDQFSWTLSFPTSTAFQVCVYRLATPMGWTDSSLKFKWLYTTSACSAGRYIDANYQCKPCAAGSFGGFAAQTSSACSGPCTAGYYCTLASSSATQNACTIGSFCPAGSSTPAACSPGHYCPAASTAAQPCAAGSVCATPATQVLCASGKYCPAATSAAAACAVGSVCANTTSQIACVSGQHCPASSTAAVPCAPGRVCVTPSTQVACLVGQYCPAATTAATACTAGFYCNVTGLSAVSGGCSAGSYCPAASTSAKQMPCQIRSYCPAQSPNMTASPAGSYCNASGMSAPIVCDAGAFCNQTGLSAVSGLCSGGFYCGAGSSLATQYSCANGTYCPIGSTNVTICPRGSHCPAPAQANHAPCPIGSYCDATGLSAFAPCTPGSFCNATGLSLAVGPCLAGYWCGGGSSASTQNECNPGFYCPLGSAAPTPTSPGYFTNVSRATASVACASGVFATLAQATACTVCSSGSHCPSTGMSAPIVCQPGFACLTGSSAPQACVAGTFAASEGSPACVSCTAGTFSASASATACTPCTNDMVSEVGASVCHVKALSSTPAPDPSSSTLSLSSVLIMGLIVGAAIAMAALAVTVAACVHRRDPSTTTDLKELKFGSVTVTDAGTEDALGSATRSAATARVAPEAPLFGALGSRQNGWTEADTLPSDPTAQHEFVNQLPRLASTQSGSEVWRVLWLRNGRAYAKKLLPSSIFASVALIQDFEIEVIMMREFRCPNLVRYFDGAAVAKRREAFIIMEYASNGNLTTYLNRQMQPLAWSAKRRLCVDVARGLEYLHARAPHLIVHGDLKSSSVLIGGDCVAKLCDFGMHDVKLGVQKSRAFKMPQAQRWAAPELAQGGTLTLEADIWALGAVMAEIAADGRPPFHALADAAVAQLLCGAQLDRAATRDLLHLPDDTPVDLVEIILDCLSWSPRARPTARRCVQLLAEGDGVDSASCCC